MAASVRLRVGKCRPSGREFILQVLVRRFPRTGVARRCYRHALWGADRPRGTGFGRCGSSERLPPTCGAGNGLRAFLIRAFESRQPRRSNRSSTRRWTGSISPRGFRLGMARSDEQLPLTRDRLAVVPAFAREDVARLPRSLARAGVIHLEGGRMRILYARGLAAAAWSAAAADCAPVADCPKA